MRDASLYAVYAKLTFCFGENFSPPEKQVMDENNKIDVSIIIPAYNEEKRVGDSLAKIAGYFSNRDETIEIIVVDDGSTDGTPDVVRRMSEKYGYIRCLRNEGNMGKGFSIKRGMLDAKGQLALFSDADLSTPIEEYEKLKEAMVSENADVVIASRALPGSTKPVRQGFLRESMGKIFGLFVKLILGLHLSETQCGFKMFTKKAAREVFHWQTIFGFGFDPEILFIAKKRGFKIAEVPVVWINDFDSKLNPVADSIKMFLELLKIRVKAWIGHYD